MPDVQFGHLGNGRDGTDRVKGQPVARMNLQPQVMGQRGTLAQGGQFGVALGVAAFGVQIAIGAGVQFDHRRADPGGGADLGRVRDR